MKYLVLVLPALALAGCTKNSDGSTSLGIKGSRAWHGTAPQADINAYYDAMSTPELCSKWRNAYRKENVRISASESLKRRGLDYNYCNDGGVSDMRREMQDQQRETERLRNEVRRLQATSPN